jgi:hypothetical protein
MGILPILTIPAWAGRAGRPCHGQVAQRAAMVSNLTVVLCSEHNAQPVLNMGAGVS